SQIAAHSKPDCSPRATRVGAGGSRGTPASTARAYSPPSASVAGGRDRCHPQGHPPPPATTPPTRGEPDRATTHATAAPARAAAGKGRPATTRRTPERTAPVGAAARAPSERSRTAEAYRIPTSSSLAASPGPKGESRITCASAAGSSHGASVRAASGASGGAG